MEYAQLVKRQPTPNADKEDVVFYKAWQGKGTLRKGFWSTTGRLILIGGELMLKDESHTIFRFPINKLECTEIPFPITIASSTLLVRYQNQAYFIQFVSNRKLQFTALGSIKTWREWVKAITDINPKAYAEVISTEGLAGKDLSSKSQTIGVVIGLTVLALAVFFLVMSILHPSS